MKKILNLPFIICIKLYRFFISPFFINSCKFEPSCSKYALTCFENYNLFKALFKTIVRIIKCNPWFDTGGYDHAIKKERK